MFEKKRGTRFLASVMALVMLLSLAPVGALAVDGETLTNEECSAMPLPANEADPKSVVTDEENTANTNEEPTPPPRNEGDTGIPADNNDTSTAISETPVISDPVQDLTGDVLYDLYDFNGRQPGANIGYVRKNYTVTYNANLPDGASLISGVSLPDAQTVLTWGQIRGLSGRNEYNRDAQVSGKNEYYKFLGWATTRNATTAEYTPGQWLSVSSDTTLYAVWERNDKDVMYFVLMPGIDAPSDGADQGYQKYYPNKTDENDQKGDDGGVSGCTVYTGYTGGNLTETGFNAVPTEGDSVVDLAGQYSNSTYLSVPSNLGYFNANTKTDELNLDMTGKEIVWYVIKNQEDGYHVDGYVKNVPIKVRYHENFNGNTAVKDTVTDIVSGDTVIVKTAGAVFGEDYTHEGYTFAGWSTSQGEDGTVYQPGDRTEQLVTSLDLYAKWVKDDSSKKTLKYTVEYYKDNEKVISDTRIVTEKVWVNAPDTLTVNKAELAPADKYPGYKFSVTAPATIADTVANNSVIKVYYVKDESQKKELKYTVEYFKDNEKVISDTRIVTEKVWVNAPDTLTVNKAELAPADKYPGYKFSVTAPATIADTVANNSVIKVYYVKDDSQKKKLQYTVEYYKDDEKVSGDTQVVKEEVWVNAPNTLTVNKAEIAPADKYTGCKLEKTDPATIPDTINHNGVIKVYYTKTEDPPAEAQYTVKHYKWDTQEKKYTLADTDVIDSTVGTDVTATAKDYTDYTLNTQASTLKGTVKAENQLTLNLYYDIDKIGSGENKDQPDKIPDRYQVTINYVSSNTNWGSVNRSKEVITLSNKESNKWLETGTVIAPSCTATSAGGKCYFVNWTKKQEGTTDVSTVTPSAKLPEQTIENAKGGDVYTFTANFDRSSGGGSGGSNRPKPPVVEIPDDVPTGLNGKDHYAYIIGYGNNDVRPQNNITRAEVATIFFRLLTDETRTANMTKSNGYNDVKDGDWFCCAVSTLSKMGIIKGYEDGSFKPNDPISRAEFAAIAARFDPDGDKTPASFSDVTSHWAKDEISIAANHGWIKGYEDGSFKPDQKITRAETMTLVNRVLNRLPEAKDDLHKDMKTWVDNMDETAWYYLAVQEATNSHYFKNKTGTKFEQWTDLRDTRDWSELEK